MHENPEIEYPIRINRYLYITNICSRREADRLIEQGGVLINGVKAVLGQQVHKGDSVTLGKVAQARTSSYKYYLYHKPVGIVSANPQHSETDAITDAKLPREFAPVGRLDKASEGLMLLTNDGRIVNKLLNPEFAHERTYRVTVNKYIRDSDLKRLMRGVDIEGYQTRPATAVRVSDSVFDLTLTEGKKHQVRRMCATLGYTIKRLVRTRMAHLRLRDLRPHRARELTNDECRELLSVLGLV